MEKKISENVKVIYPDAEEREEISLNRVERAIKEWYQITQSTMKILFDLKKSNKPMSDNQKDIFNTNLKKFGWHDIKDKKDIVADFEHLDDVHSPYCVLSNEFGIANTMFNKRKKMVDRVTKKVSGWSKSYKEELYKQTIDESGGIGDLYRASEYISEKAKTDVEDFPILKDRYDELFSDLENLGGSFSKGEYIEGFVDTFIRRAIEIGYTAGMNANITEMWRKTNKDKPSIADMTYKEWQEKQQEKASANKKVTKNNKK